MTISGAAADKNVDRKVILTNYLNTINLGSNTLGVKAAALRYFNKDVSDLTFLSVRSSPVSLRIRQS
ncbi:MAG: transglycosylase domain-containing protein [Clostridium fessum]